MRAIQWSPTNGALACGGADGRAHLLKPTGELLGRIPGVDDATANAAAAAAAPAIHALAFSKGSRYLATGCASPDVVIWDLKRKAKLKTLSGHTAGSTVDAVVYSPGDQHIASGGTSGVVILHSPISGLAVGEMNAGGEGGEGGAGSGGVTSLHYSPHRRHLLASSCSDGAVHLWDTGIRRLAFSVDAAAGGATTTSTAGGGGVGGGSGGCCWQASFSPTTPGLVAAACGDGLLHRSQDFRAQPRHLQGPGRPRSRR